MTQAVAVLGRAVATCTPRKRVTGLLFMLIAFVFTVAVLSTVSYDGPLDQQDDGPSNQQIKLKVKAQFPREDKMEQKLADMQANIQFLETLYRERQEEVLYLQQLVKKKNPVIQQPTTMTPELKNLIKNISGTRAAAGLHPKNLLLRAPFVYQLLPHLMDNPHSLRPAYHMKGPKEFTDIVLGIPTVRRDKESYLLITLEHLIDGLTSEDANTTLIVVFIGETDLEYVVSTARQIETLFPKQVKDGLIEVISPSPHFYPNLESMSPTLGDSQKRFKWRTKQNLDALYLMAYAQTKGTYYLMLEDDVICKKSYMQEIKTYTAAVSVANPKWFFIEYCPIGGIGKLFRSSDLLHFITYVQLFYHNLPIDWLLESYLADRICNIEKSMKECKKNKLLIRPKYKTSLFQHIGVYSSLKGKIQKVKDPKFQARPTFYPHHNPSLENLKTDIEEHGDHTLLKAYQGHTFFWGMKPKKGNVVEFWFTEPIYIKRYTFRSGNVEHVTDKFYYTSVEVLKAGVQNFTKVGSFDEFGMADGNIATNLLPAVAIRLKVERDNPYWVILSEIDIQVKDDTSR